MAFFPRTVRISLARERQFERESVALDAKSLANVVKA